MQEAVNNKQSCCFESAILSLTKGLHTSPHYHTHQINQTDLVKITLSLILYNGPDQEICMDVANSLPHST